jgi:hypothetical protein
VIFAFIIFNIFFLAIVHGEEESDPMRTEANPAAPGNRHPAWIYIKQKLPPTKQRRTSQTTSHNSLIP